MAGGAAETSNLGGKIKGSDMKPRINCPAPTLGQDNHAVYVEGLGLSEEEYTRLTEEKVI